jgi:hypothetical protein
MIQYKKAAMEMTMGTMVTIVLLTMVLILGGYFVSKIFTSGGEAIDGIDTAVKNEIDKLFAEDSSKKIVVYPATRKITIKKGKDNLGFGFSIRNVKTDEAKFSYEVNAIESNCNMRLSDADNMIALGKERTGIQLAAGSMMSDPIFVRFAIPATAPPCQIRYEIKVYEGSKSGSIYGAPIDVDLEILSE